MCSGAETVGLGDGDEIIGRPLLRKHDGNSLVSIFLDVGYDKDYDAYGFGEYRGGYSDPYRGDSYNDEYSYDYQPSYVSARRGMGRTSMVGDHFGFSLLTKLCS